MVEAIHSSKKSVLTRTAWHNIPEDGILQVRFMLRSNEDIQTRHTTVFPKKKKKLIHCSQDAHK
jgi:hypothetical protein